MFTKYPPKNHIKAPMLVVSRINIHTSSKMPRSFVKDIIHNASCKDKKLGLNQAIDSPNRLL
jgi:hypothetical protein